MSRPRHYCGRSFSAAELAVIRELIADHPGLNRAQLSRLVCERLEWRRPDGRLKDMSCRVAMLRMAADGVLELPAPLKRNGNAKPYIRRTPLADVVRGGRVYRMFTRDEGEDFELPREVTNDCGCVLHVEAWIEEVKGQIRQPGQNNDVGDEMRRGFPAADLAQLDNDVANTESENDLLPLVAEQDGCGCGSPALAAVGLQSLTERPL